MRCFALVVLLASCSGPAGFLAEDGAAPDAASAIDASGGDASGLDAELGDAGGYDAVADAWQPSAPDAAPDTWQPPPQDSGADAYVSGRCYAPGFGTRSCTQITPFRVKNPQTMATTPCDQSTPPCPLGWECEWQPNGQKGSCIP